MKSIRKIDKKFPMRILLHAPSVHVGGGLHLLESLLEPNSASFKWVQLDKRIQSKGLLTGKVAIHWVKKSLWSRLWAEWRLFNECAKGDAVLCFHGLPPLFHLRGQVVVFAQNKLLFDSSPLYGYPFLTMLRLMAERCWVRMLSRNCDRYIVQTPSMASLVRCSLINQAPISVCPFIGRISDVFHGTTRVSSPQYNFIYIASGEPHKNHDNLLLAWRLLAEAGLKPSLAVTVDALSHPWLASEIAKQRDRHDLNIVNLGRVASTDIPALYKSSSALIFPSKVESFGLPLIEATQMGLPVLASELDYVRDVIEPVETFNPESPISIARAVRRFLKNPDPTTPIGSPEEFLAEVLR
jgi:glycosyltransferase involved in cell wall biosynthesis